MRKSTVYSLVMATSLWLAPAHAADVTSQSFIQDAIEGNLAEMQVGKLAQQRGQSEAVRSFGQMLERDHAEANQRAASIAAVFGVDPPTQPNDKQRAVYDRLSKLSSREFDWQFVADMIEDHEADMSKFESEAKKSDQAADYAKQTLPMLRNHLLTAQRLSPNTTGSR
jgi:putative membrane protein